VGHPVYPLRLGGDKIAVRTAILVNFGEENYIVVNFIKFFVISWTPPLNSQHGGYP